MENNSSTYVRPKLILVGGFLGAGKTTVLSVLTEMLHRQSYTVGIITNDQSTGLVDTHILKLGGATVEEVSGSCFCCDFQGFIGAINYLIHQSNCNVIVAEPVGSCTDLSATLLQPLKAVYGDEIDLAPLSVLLDPIKLRRMAVDFNKEGDGTAYIYFKQLEEADYIVVNKTDLLDDKECEKIEALISKRFPEHDICRMSAMNNSGLAEWLKRIMDDPNPGRRLAAVDYDTYALAEAMTGWYNGSFKITGAGHSQVDWYAFQGTLLDLLEKVFDHEGIRIDHLKTFLKDGTSHLLGNIAGNGISIRGNAFHSVSARLVLNIRAVTTHFRINEIVEDVIQLFEQYGFRFEVISKKHLSPGRPQPQYRYGEVI